MFCHLFFYRLKCLLRNRLLVFWTLLFPLFVATLYHFAFGQMMTGGASFSPISVAVIDNTAYRENAWLQQVLTALSTPGEGQLLNLTLGGEELATELLEQNSVAGIIAASAEGVELQVNRTGLGQSILKTILDDYLQTTSTVHSILQQNPAAAPGLLASLTQRVSYTVEKSFSNVEPNMLLMSFYALLANTCLFGSSWGLKNSSDAQANLSAQGLRRGTAPTHKLVVVLSDTLAALVLTFSEVLLLLAYLILVCGVQFGSALGSILLVCLLGSLVGVAFGTTLGTLLRQQVGTKSAVMSVIILTLSFLSGMMLPKVKYLVDRAVPWFSYVNPVALISDAFYSLYVFDSPDRFLLNAGLLGLTAVTLTVISYLGLRSERYASL